MVCAEQTGGSSLVPDRCECVYSSMHRYLAGVSAGSSQQITHTIAEVVVFSRRRDGLKIWKYHENIITTSTARAGGIREKEDTYMRYTFICASIGIAIHIPILEYVCAGLRVVVWLYIGRSHKQGEKRKCILMLLEYLLIGVCKDFFRVIICEVCGQARSLNGVADALQGRVISDD
mmetsp:Transcript_64719/g.104735  ORF Transcript_64719/g.104735 Transcript_64719/m.104735 type:complete len:176 (+) Transcript_64719:163-690(+)